MYLWRAQTWCGCRVYSTGGALDSIISVKETWLDVRQQILTFPVAARFPWKISSQRPVPPQDSLFCPSSSLLVTLENIIDAINHHLFARRSRRSPAADRAEGRAAGDAAAFRLPLLLKRKGKKTAASQAGKERKLCRRALFRVLLCMEHAERDTANRGTSRNSTRRAATLATSAASASERNQKPWWLPAEERHCRYRKNTIQGERVNDVS